MCSVAVVNNNPINVFATFCTNLQRTGIGVVRTLPRLNNRPNVLCTRGGVCSVTNCPTVSNNSLMAGLGRRVSHFSAGLIFNRRTFRLRGGTSNVFRVRAAGGHRCSGTIVVSTNGNTFQPEGLRVRRTSGCRGAGLRCFIGGVRDFHSGAITVYNNKSSTIS